MTERSRNNKNEREIKWKRYIIWMDRIRKEEIKMKKFLSNCLNEYKREWKNKIIFL